MAKDYKKMDEQPASDVTETSEPKQVVPDVVMSFDRWFLQTGRPAHHKAGLMAFATTSGKRTVASWNKVFEAY